MVDPLGAWDQTYRTEQLDLQNRTAIKKQENWSRLDFLFLFENGCVLR